MYSCGENLYFLHRHQCKTCGIICECESNFDGNPSILHLSDLQKLLKCLSAYCNNCNNYMLLYDITKQNYSDHNLRNIIT